jgi:hypothetical protein
MTQAAPAESRTDLVAALRGRRAELEQAILTRIFALADPSGNEESQYVEGLRRAAGSALEYGLTAIELGAERAGSPPPVLLAQARLAARMGIGLEIVLRRYFAGYALLADYVIDEAKRRKLADTALLQQITRDHAALFDLVLIAVSDEYRREAEERRRNSGQRRFARVERLLAGELVDVSGVLYDFEAHHLGLIAFGAGAADSVTALAAALDRRPLSIEAGEELLWVWLGGRRPMDPEAIAGALDALDGGTVSFAIGEPARGLDGWRLTHHQARSAWSVACRRSDQRFTRYADVALLAAAGQDEVLMRTLDELYLTPLREKRERGTVLLETLRTYYRTDRSITATAATLRVTRQTVRSRLCSVEKLIGRPLTRCALEMEVALRLDVIHGTPLRGWPLRPLPQAVNVQIG